MSDTVKYFLEESKAPKFWYNINADLPSPPPPPLHPGTKQPAGPDDGAVGGRGGGPAGRGAEEVWAE